MMTHFHGNIAFNAHHSPMGAYLSFTCGHFGTRGGLAAQLGKPANQDIFVGVKDGDRYAAVPLRVLPFFDGADKLDPRAAYTQQVSGDPQRFAPYTKEEIAREYGWGTDRWKTEDFEFSIYTPFGAIPDPAVASAEDLRDALLPAIIAELIVDNRAGTKTKTAFFAINFNAGGARILDAGLSSDHVGFALKSNLGVVGHVADFSKDGLAAPAPFAFLRWWPHEGLEDRSNPVHLLGTTPGIGVEVPAGKSVALRFALGCYLPEIVTTRLEGRYFYNRYYSTLLEVLNTAGARFCELKRAAKTQDEKLAGSGLSADQQFLIAHSTRSYYANTELLEIGGEPYWIVNEGEYCMMNTLDLAVDQVFWELEQNPWVVRNLLDNFLKRYSYVDEVKRETTIAPGGLSFCHDQGSHNQFSPFGHSAYELKDLTGCLSYMTQEELCNWILIATTYVEKTGDREWVAANTATIQQCFQSMIARREGEGDMMRYDSALCGTGREITTYDSLDVSLGQARSNIYLAIKCWAAYMGLRLLSYAGGDKAQVAHFAGNEIEKLEWDLASIVRDRDAFPAVFELESPGLNSRILPAIESLIFPLFWNKCTTFPSGMKRTKLVTLDEQTPLEPALRKHTITLLADPDHRNKFPDEAGGGGIKLSSTSNNSWLSKIAIIQHVARSLFNLDENGEERSKRSAVGAATVMERSSVADAAVKSLPHGRGSEGWEKSDAAHVRWLTTGPGAFWCASDQIVSGVAQGSRYYPRLITTALWLNESSMR